MGEIETGRPGSKTRGLPPLKHGEQASHSSPGGMVPSAIHEHRQVVVVPNDPTLICSGPAKNIGALMEPSGRPSEWDLQPYESHSMARQTLGRGDVVTPSHAAKS